MHKKKIPRYLPYGAALDLAGRSWLFYFNNNLSLQKLVHINSWLREAWTFIFFRMDGLQVLALMEFTAGIQATFLVLEAGGLFIWLSNSWFVIFFFPFVFLFLLPNQLWIYFKKNSESETAICCFFLKVGWFTWRTVDIRNGGQILKAEVYLKVWEIRVIFVENTTTC